VNTATNPNPNDDHANGATGATQVGLSAVAQGTIEVAGDVDAFAVNLRANLDYSFATVITGAMDTTLTLIDTDGVTQLAQNDDRAAGDPSSWIDYTAAQDGTYYLIVAHADPQGTGDYGFMPALAGGVTPPADDHANDWNGATAIAVGQATNGELERGGDVDYFKLDLLGGTDYVFMTDNLQNGMDSVLTLFASDGTTVLEVNDDSPAAPMQLASHVPGAPGQAFTPTADGTYYLAVEHYDPAGTGLYTVRGEVATPVVDDHGNDHLTATAAVTSSVVAGNIEIGGDSDWFAVDLQAGVEYEFMTDNLQNGMDSILVLYDTDGTTQLDINDDSPAAPVFLASRIPDNPNANFTPAQAGTYYLEVIHYDPTAVGTYDLALRQLSGGAPDDHGNDAMTATALTLGQPTAGRIEVTADEDWFSIDLTTGDDFSLATITSGNTTLALYDDQGNLIDQNDDEDAAAGKLNSKLSYTATASATYYVAIAGGNNDTPSYEVLVELTTPPAVPAVLTAATLNDLDGSYQASMGDTLVLTFNADVALVSTALADQELMLPIVNDSFGQGATVIGGPGANEVTVTLGADPVLRTSGTYIPMTTIAPPPGSASGVELSAQTTITTVGNGLAVTGIVDLESTLTAGFKPAAPLVTPRGLHTATVLDDGRVLVVGGLADNQAFTAQSEVYDNGVWTEVSDPALGGNPGGFLVGQGPNGAFATVRFSHTATKLASGEVLIVGGFGVEAFDANGNPIQGQLASAYLFDPQTNTFTATAGGLAVARSDHYATLLPNGQVLITGGYNGAMNQGNGSTLPVAELYDPFTRTFTPLSQNGQDMVIPRQAGTATAVNGKVLYAGGQAFVATQQNPTPQLYMAPDSESFDPATALFTADGALNQNRRYHAASVAASGELFVLGGDSGAAALADVEKYDPATSSFAAVGSLSAPRARVKSAPVGKNVLVVGGIEIDYQTQQVTDVPSGELYNTAANVTETYMLQSPRNSHRVVALPDGRALVVGGYAGSTTVLGTTGTTVSACEVFVIP